MKRLFMLAVITALLAPNSSLKSQITNTNLSNYTFWDTEPFIAVNPTNSNNIIAAWMHATGFGQLSIATKYSTDGGTTWSSSVVNMPHINSTYTSADVSIAFNNSGDAFLCYIDSRIQNDSGYVRVTKSSDGGVTWSTPTTVIASTASADFPIDRPWIAVDRSGGAYNGMLYVVNKSVDFGQMPHHVWMERSADNGLTWSTPLLIDNAIPTDLVTNAMGAVTVGADGAMYVAYPSWHLASSPFARMIIVKSTDGGATFTPYVVGNATSNSAITDSLLQGSYAVAANPVNASDLVLVFTDNRNGDADILSTRSTDGGQTWSAPIRATDDPMSNGNNQDMCWAAYAENGFFVTGWRDRRNSAGGSQDNFEIYVTASSDNGLAYGTNVNMSSAQSPYVNIVKGNDFIGVCSDGTNIFTDWCDNRTGNTEIFFAKTPLTSVLSVPEADALVKDLKVYPNPVGSNAQLNCSFYLAENGRAEVKIISGDGKETLISKQMELHNGANELQFNTSSLASGNYILLIEKDGKRIGEKSFVK